MKELEELTADIREKLPRLMELQEGSIVTLNKLTAFVIHVGDNNIYYTEEWNPNLLNWTDKEYFIKNMLLLSYNVRLNEVLEWLNTLKQIDVWFTNDTFILRYNPIDDLGTYVKWDLSKPYLKDQSPELIAFLHSLIKTKQ